MRVLAIVVIAAVLAIGVVVFWTVRMLQLLQEFEDSPRD